MKPAHHSWTVCCLFVLIFNLGGDAIPDKGQTKLDLSSHFEWTTGSFRSETSVKREQPACIGFTDGEDETFTSDRKPFSLVQITLRAKQSGVLDLMPEFFLVRDRLQYRVCQGIRLLKPSPDPKAAAFHPPNHGSVWPGHAGDRITCHQGDEIIVELLFQHVWNTEKAKILVVTQIQDLM